MTQIWHLIHQSTSAADEIATSKSIGFFSTRARAEDAIVTLCRFHSYQRDRRGFRIYPLALDEGMTSALSDDILFGPEPDRVGLACGHDEVDQAVSSADPSAPDVPGCCARGGQ